MACFAFTRATLATRRHLRVGSQAVRGGRARRPARVCAGHAQRRPELREPTGLCAFLRLDAPLHAGEPHPRLDLRPGTARKCSYFCARKRLRESENIEREERLHCFFWTLAYNLFHSFINRCGSFCATMSCRTATFTTKVSLPSARYAAWHVLHELCCFFLCFPLGNNDCKVSAAMTCNATLTVLIPFFCAPPQTGGRHHSQSRASQARWLL